MKKLLILLTFILFSSLASATILGDLQDSAIIFLDFETSGSENIDLIDGMTFTEHNSPNYNDVTAKYGGGSMCASGQTIGLLSPVMAAVDELSIVFWFNKNSYGIGNGNIFNWGDGTGSNAFIIRKDDNNKLTYVYNQGSVLTISTNTLIPTGDEWTFMATAFSLDDNTLSGYYDQDSTEYRTTSNTDVAVGDPRLGINIADYTVNYGYQGCYDNFLVLDRAITETEMEWLASNEFTLPSPITSFQITANQTYWNVALTTFNATVNGTAYTTTNGTIVTSLINENNAIDITLYANNHDTKIFSGYNVSTNLATTLDYYKYILNVTAKDQFNNIIPYNLSINSTLYETTNASVLYAGDKNTYYGLEIDKTGYFSLLDTIYLNWWVTEYNYTLYWDHYKLNVTANDFWGNPIQNFSITAVGSNTVAGSTTEFNTVLELNQNETYDIEIDANNYALDNISLSMDYWLTNHTFTLYTTNSINFSFFEEGTGYFLNNITVNIELISAAYSNNYSTSNGSLYVDLLSPSDYTARYSAPDYNENFYYFTLVNRTHSIIDLFLSVAAATTEITATVYDNTNNILEDVEIRAARYDIESNTYILVSECKTNFLGECKLNLVKNTEYYKFFLYYQGVLRKTTSPSYIYDNLLNFQISLEDPSGTDYYNSQKIVSALVFNAATNNFRFTFSDNTGIGSKFCLDVDKKTSLKTVAFNSSCTTGASGVILINIPEINGTTFSAIGTAYINEQPVFLNGLTKTWINTAPDSNLFMLFLIILTLLATFIFTFSITAGILVIPLPMVLFAVLGLVKIETGIAIGVEILALILAIILNRNG